MVLSIPRGKVSRFNGCCGVYNIHRFKDGWCGGGYNTPDGCMQGREKAGMVAVLDWCSHVCGRVVCRPCRLNRVSTAAVAGAGAGVGRVGTASR